MARKNKIAGIYRIVNKQNGKYYLGSSLDIHHRWVAHKSQLRRDKHENSYFQRAWKKYGEENFEFEIFEVLEKNRERILLREQELLDELKPYEEHIGYNLSFSATGGVHNLGKTFTKEHCQRISEALKGREFTSEHCDNIAKALKGKFPGEKNPFYGKEHTEETRKLMSKNHSDCSGPKNPASKVTKGIGQEIYNEYYERGLKQTDLAKKYGVSQRTVSLITQGRHWTVKAK